MRERIRPTLRLRLTLWFVAVAIATGFMTSVVTPVIPYGEVIIVAVIAAGALLGYVVTGRALRPLHEVTETARRLGTNSLHDRIHLDGPRDEVRELADTFDAMLDRISDAFTAQQRFTANASHELRTPLAVIRTEVDVALANPDDDVADLRRMARVVQAASIRANDLIESLLLLAQLQAEKKVQMEPFDLAVCATNACKDVELMADDMGLAIATHTDNAPVLGNPALLERVAGNLVENAVRHNIQYGQVWVATGTTAEHSWLVVGNTGKKIDEGVLDQLKEPFHRGNEPRVGGRGAGLGLSIVSAACDVHDAQMVPRTIDDGELHGMEFKVTFPLYVSGKRVASRPSDSPPESFLPRRGEHRRRESVQKFRVIKVGAVRQTAPITV